MPPEAAALSESLRLMRPESSAVSVQPGEKGDVASGDEDERHEALKDPVSNMLTGFKKNRHTREIPCPRDGLDHKASLVGSLSMTSTDWHRPTADELYIGAARAPKAPCAPVKPFGCWSTAVAAWPSNSVRFAAGPAMPYAP